MTITQTVDVPENRQITLPCEVPTGKANVIIQFPVQSTETTSVNVEKKTPIFGCLKGQIWMSDDFDEPLDDFKDYM